MTLQQRLDAAQFKSVHLYLRRVEIEEQKQALTNQMNQLMSQARQVDADLVRMDGVIDLLDALIAEGANG